MAVKIVTAPPGTGKTLELIRMIFEYLAQGRRIFSNISSLKIVEVLPIPSDQDWRDLPDGSVVIYDEAHEHPAFSKEDLIDYPEFEEPEQAQGENLTTFKERYSKLKRAYEKQKKQHYESIKDIARALKIHRHFGFDIILATQDSSDLNARTLNVIGEHYHLTRPFGFRNNVCFFWRRHVSSPDSLSERSRAEWKKVRKFNKNYFHLYHSANVHTHKANFPIKYILVGLIVIALIFAPIYYALTQNKAVKMYTGQDKELIPTHSAKTDIVVNKEMPTNINDLSAFDAVSASAPVETDYMKQVAEKKRIYEQMMAKEQEQQISGCVYFNGKYTAVDEYARPIHNKAHLCRDVIQNADRTAMKRPSRQTYVQTNDYSPEAQQQLETSRIVQAQREYFNEP